MTDVIRRNRTLKGKFYVVGSLEKAPLALAMNSIMVVLLNLPGLSNQSNFILLFFFDKNLEIHIEHA